MTLKESLNWLPTDSSGRRSHPAGLISKILLIALFLLLLTRFSPALFSQVFGQTAETKVSIVGRGAITTTSIAGIVGGEQIYLDVRVDNVTDSDGLAAQTFKIKYNPALFFVADGNNDYIADSGVVTQGSFLGSTGKRVNCGQGYIDPDPNNASLRLLTFTCLTLGLTPAGAGGSGVLATIKFTTGNTTGSQTLTLIATQLADNSITPNLIPHSTVNLLVLVTDCADFNGDGTVRVSDILYVTGKYRTSDAAADLNDDGVVLIDDVLIAVAQYFKDCP